MAEIVDWDILVRLGIAAFFGATVGMERYMHGRPAGLRTYLLVCVAFASIALIGEKYWILSAAPNNAVIRPDPARLMAGGLTGIGFLGAGIIIRGGVTVHGLTTAAGIWAISVVGLAVGTGSYFLATALYLTTFVSLMALRWLEQSLKRDLYRSMEIGCRKGDVSREALEKLCVEKRLRVVRVDVRENRSTNMLTYRYLLTGRTERSFHEAYEALSARDEIQSIALREDAMD